MQDIFGSFLHTLPALKHKRGIAMPCKRVSRKKSCRSKPDHDRSFCKRLASFFRETIGMIHRDRGRLPFCMRDHFRFILLHLHIDRIHIRNLLFFPRVDRFFHNTHGFNIRWRDPKQFRAFFSDIIVPVLQWHLDLRKSYHLFLHSFPARSAAAHPATAPLDHAHCKL